MSIWAIGSSKMYMNFFKAFAIMAFAAVTTTASAPPVSTTVSAPTVSTTVSAPQATTTASLPPATTTVSAPPVTTTAPICPDAADIVMKALSKALAENASPTDAVCIRRLSSNKIVCVGQVLHEHKNKALILRPNLKNVYEITEKQNYQICNGLGCQQFL